MSAIYDSSWRESALVWIDDQSARLPWPVPTGWRPAEATVEARLLTIHILRATPDDLPPASIGVTTDHGIVIEWRHGGRELELEVLANATLELSTWEAAELLEQAAFESSALWRLCGFFAWLRNTQ